jgi:murein DD-endopeptidase MepM/ murein hydrolase activator NlpD
MRPRRIQRRVSHAHRVPRPDRQAPPEGPWLIPPRRPRRAAPVALLVLAVSAAAVLAAGQLAPRGAATDLIDRSGDAAATRAALSAAERSTALVRRSDPLGDRPELDARLAPPLASLTGYRWPLVHARITQAFGPSSGGTFIVGGKSFHDGVDIASFCGDHIVAAHGGVVIAAGRRTDAALGWVGNLAAYHARLDERNLWGTLAIIVVIDDGNGYRSIYAHFHRIVVRAGQAVHAGALLGTEGATGHASGCHLHYGLYSPAAVGRFRTDPVVVARTLIPAGEIARIDPLVVLPPLKAGFNTWGWGAGDGH